jgi:hypothetical protein
VKLQLSQAANVGFCRVFKLVRERCSIRFFLTVTCGGGTSRAERVHTGLQAKPDAGKLVLATIALLVASLSNILIVGIRHLL